MKVSEAIRLGSMLRPVQAFGVLFDESTGGTCAIGAAAEAVGVLDLTHHNRYLGKAPVEWKAFMNTANRCPACTHPFPFARVDDTMRHLNNKHRWTRERIADYVEQLEAQQDVAARAVPGTDAKQAAS